MNNGFDLNIDNYTLKELEELFELPSNYNEQLIDKQESKLRHNIAVDRSIVALTKNNTLDFINKVKKILVANCKQTTASSSPEYRKYPTVYLSDCLCAVLLFLLQESLP